jgi:hypothetical protein
MSDDNFQGMLILSIFKLSVSFQTTSSEPRLYFYQEDEMHQKVLRVHKHERGMNL